MAEPFPDLSCIQTGWQFMAMNLLVESLRCHFDGRRDFYASGCLDLCDRANRPDDLDCRGPDFFYMRGIAPDPRRPCWKVWQECGRYPEVVIEFTTPDAAKDRRATKRALYQTVFRVDDLIYYDPEDKMLVGWTANDHREYTPLQHDDQGRLWCKALNLWLGLWDGANQRSDDTWLRFYTPAGEVVPIYEESHRRQADASDQRAKMLAPEVARLKAELAAKRKRRKP